MNDRFSLNDVAWTSRPVRWLLLVGWAVLLVGCYRKPAVTDSHVDNSANPLEVTDDSLPGSSDYVGSEKCAECHEAISEQYAMHSMGRSAGRLDANVALAGQPDFEAGGFRYSASSEQGVWVHRQARIAADGTEVAAMDLVAQHVIGSGNHGQSFLVSRGNQLFMSPMTWYPDRGFWALSPGYERNNSEFNRPVVALCLYCHTDSSEPVPDTLNTFSEATIRRHAIGCERCHGPGREHIAKHEGVSATDDDGTTSMDDSIVNPAHLEPSLREAVCQQCHLSGVARVVKPAKSLNDYRPGEPLESAYTIFTRTVTNQPGEDRFVGQVEQMYASRCFTQSDGQLGCISCHDPHGLPAESDRVAFYRDRCLQCHTDQSCSTPSTERRTVTAEDSCIVCHMPSRETEVRHASSTDHSIPRGPANRSEVSAASSSGPAITAFPSNEVARPTPRDLAIALVQFGGKQPELVSTTEINQATATLKDVVTKNPDDFEACEALAELYLAGNDFANALAACQIVLARQPRREQSLVLAADICSEQQNFGQAIPYWRTVIDVNPWISRYWYRLGQAYAATRQWYVCRQTAMEAKRRFPTSIGVRHLLMESNLALGDRAAVDAEFRELVQFNPPAIGALRAWYDRSTGQAPQR